jgi:hypothetical protein
MQEVLPPAGDPVMQASAGQPRLLAIPRTLLLTGQLPIQPAQLRQVLAQRLLRLDQAGFGAAVSHRKCRSSSVTSYKRAESRSPLRLKRGYPDLGPSPFKPLKNRSNAWPKRFLPEAHLRTRVPI